jgi:hypothetical protein
MLSGTQLYGSQLVETNPPLIIWFSTIPVSLSHLLHLDPYVALKVIVFVLIGGSMLWSARLLRSTDLVNSPFLSYLSLGALLSAEIFLLPYAFGQREHLLVLLVLPYVLSGIAPDRSRLSIIELCAIGIAAGIGVCFKPQQVLILAALEFFLAIWTRSLHRLVRPESVCALLAILVYIASVRVFAPLYFSQTMPIMRDTYWAYGPASTWYLVKTAPIFDFFFLVSVGGIHPEEA